MHLIELGKTLSEVMQMLRYSKKKKNPNNIRYRAY